MDFKLFIREDKEMSINVNQDYSQFYKEAEPLKSCGSNSVTKKNAQEKTPAKAVISNMAEQSVTLSISDEGREYYRNNIQQNGQETYNEVLQRREQLKNEKINRMDYSYEIQKRAAQQNKNADTGRSTLSTIDKANGYVKAYAELYDEIVQGYDNGNRKIYAADESGTHKLTKDDELGALDAAYKKTVDNFVTMEKTNQHAREIIGEEMKKISKITSRSTLAATCLEEQKSRGTDEIPENISEKMYDAIFSFKEKYAMFHSDAGNLSQLLASVKIS